MPGGAATTTGGHLKNVLIGVLTTVISAAIVYFLGFHDSGNDDIKKAKQATVEAWESLMTYERSFKNAGIRMVCSGDESAMEKDILSEYGKIIDNIANIKEEKKDKADNRVISLIDRRVATLKEKMDETAEYYRQLHELDSANITQGERDSLEIVQENSFTKKMGELETQDKDFIDEINADLKKKYKVEFNYPPPFLVKPEALIGKWSMDRAINLELKKDYNFTLEKDNTNYPGKWGIDSLTLHFNFSDGDNYSYIITGGGDRVIAMKSSTDSSFHYFCRQ